MGSLCVLVVKQLDKEFGEYIRQRGLDEEMSKYVFVKLQRNERLSYSFWLASLKQYFKPDSPMIGRGSRFGHNFVGLDDPNVDYYQKVSEVTNPGHAPANDDEAEPTPKA